MNNHYRMNDAYWNEIKQGLYNDIEDTEWRTWTGNKEWRETAEQIRDQHDGDMVQIPEFNLYSLHYGNLATWRAPRGWNNYLQSGNFKGCRPIIKSGAKFNMNAFEAINFEMV